MSTIRTCLTLLVLCFALLARSEARGLRQASEDDYGYYKIVYADDTSLYADDEFYLEGEYTDENEGSIQQAPAKPEGAEPATSTVGPLQESPKPLTQSAPAKKRKISKSSKASKGSKTAKGSKGKGNAKAKSKSKDDGKSSATTKSPSGPSAGASRYEKAPVVVPSMKGVSPSTEGVSNDYETVDAFAALSDMAKIPICGAYTAAEYVTEILRAEPIHNTLLLWTLGGPGSPYATISKVFLDYGFDAQVAFVTNTRNLFCS